MSRALETRIRKLKDGEGNYIWQNSIQAGMPNALLAILFSFPSTHHRPSQATPTSQYLVIFHSTGFAMH